MSRNQKGDFAPFWPLWKSLSHKDDITDLAISPDGQWLVTGSWDGTAYLYNLEEPSANPHFLPAYETAINTVTISPDGQWLVTGSSDGTARLYNLDEPELLANSLVLRGHEDDITAVAISSDGLWLVTGSWDGTAHLYNLENLSANPFILDDHKSQITDLAISPDAQRLVTGSYDGRARLYNLEEPLADPLTLPAGTVFTISPDGQWFVTGSSDGAVRLYKLEDPLADPLILHGHEGYIATIAISPDGQWLVTGSYDKTARLWNLEDPSAGSLILRGHQDHITELAFSPDGQWLVTGGRDNTARLWMLSNSDLIDEACRRAGRNLTQTEWQQYFRGEPYRKTCQNWPVHNTVARSLMEEAGILAREGHINDALIKFEEVQSLYPNVEPEALDWYTLCRNGSLWGYVAEVMDACERAVELDPDDGHIIDSRGLARALMGDHQGAIEDFEFYVEWSKENNYYEKYGTQRESWIKELKAGHNPFDEETLEALKD